MSETSSPNALKTWPDYRAVWRWHFYASLLCIPFVIILSISGGIYLFKPQIEAWNDLAFDRLDIKGTPASAAEQARAAMGFVPASTFNGYELPNSPHSAARVLVRQKGETVRVYVHPETLEVLHTFPESQRFLRVIHRLHGELLIGDRGSMIVELAASWTIVMILTGLYLWWPRGTKGMAGVVYPRLRLGSRVFWRDLHGVTGVWIAIFALFLLFSGLPWSKSWGTYFKAVRNVTGTAVARQDWAAGSETESASESTSKKDRSDSSGDHAEHGGNTRPAAASDSTPKLGRQSNRDDAPSPNDLTPIDRVAAKIRPLGLLPPVVIAPLGRGTADWTAKSMTPNRPYRVNLVVNGATGEIVSRENFSDRHWIDQIVGVGITAHEGQLFGWPNQLLGLLTALGLILVCVSGVVMWWRRREAGVLGAPRMALTPRLSWSLIALVVAIGVYLPMFGATLLLMLIVERGVLSRIPRVRDWLGLRVRSTASKPA